MQVNFNEKSRSGINRGEFIEALMRIAKIKYVDTGHFKRTALSEAFAKLLEEEIIKKMARARLPQSGAIETDMDERDK